MSQKVGGVLVDVQTSLAKVQKDFKGMTDAVRKFSYQSKKLIKSVGYSLGIAFSGREMYRFIVGGAKMINMMQDMAQSSGMSTRILQGWVQAASYSGVEADGVARAIKRLNTNILDANYGLLESKRLFDDLDVEYQTVEGHLRDLEKVMNDVSNEFANMEDGSRKAALANKLFGRAGARMIPSLNMSAAGIEKVTKNLKKWGALGQKK